MTHYDEKTGIASGGFHNSLQKMMNWIITIATSPVSSPAGQKFCVGVLNFWPARVSSEHHGGGVISVSFPSVLSLKSIKS